MGIGHVAKIVISVAWLVLVMVGLAHDFNPAQHSLLRHFFGLSFLLSAPVWIYWGVVALWGPRWHQLVQRYSLLYKLPLMALVGYGVVGAWPLAIDWYARVSLVAIFMGAGMALFFAVIPAWKRYFARGVDYFLHGMLVTLVLLLAKYWGCHMAANLLDTGHLYYSLALAFITVWTWVPIEAWLTQRFGTTPGKALFKVVLQPTHKKTTYRQAFKRAVWVVWQGMGAGIPGVDMLAQAYNYSRLWHGQPLAWANQTFTVSTPVWTVCRQWAVLFWIVVLWGAYTLVEKLTLMLA